MPCHSCGKFGNWKSSHKADGTLPENFAPFDNAFDFASTVCFKDQVQASEYKKVNRSTVTFNMIRDTNPFEARLAIPEHSFAGIVQQAMDEIDDTIDFSLENGVQNKKTDENKTEFEFIQNEPEFDANFF